eukprot:Sspe_Gene.79815::Locus_50150_Transcript_6_6_Confidence_0.400_Length_1386::g.79815::m.79815
MAHPNTPMEDDTSPTVPSPLTFLPKIPESKLSPVCALVPELLLEIFSYMSMTDLKTMRAVCRGFAEFLEQWFEFFWAKRLVHLHSESPPAPRTCHSSVCYGNKMFCLGGMPQSTTISHVKKELCVLDLETWEWNTFASDVPAVTEQTAVVWGSKMVVFGGYHEDSGRGSQVYIFDSLETPPYRARRVTCTTSPGHLPPNPRSSHSAVLHGDSMYIFGGWERVVAKNDLYRLDLNTMEWYCETSDTSNNHQRPANIPSPRRAHVAFTANNRMFIFGGAMRENAQDYNCPTATIHYYEFTEKQWYVREVYGDIPCPRSRCRGEIFNGHYFLVGGWDRKVYLNDMYVFNTDTFIWRRLSVHVPFGLIQHSVVTWRDKLLIFGGHKYPKAKRNPLQSDGMTTNELYMYHLRAGLSEASVALTRATSSASSVSLQAAPEVAG